MARVLVNPRIGAHAKGDDAHRSGKDMRDILGVYDQMVYDTVSKTYKPATRADLPG